MNKIYLYHGTSSYFLKDIKNNGLTNFNIDKKYKAIAEMMYALKIMKSYKYPKNKSFISKINTIKHIADQDNAYFKYNSLFVSNSPHKAAEYACNNQFGSELLSNAVYIAKIIIPLLDDKELEYFKHHFGKIYNIMDYVNTPILLKLKVKFISIKDKDGKSISPEIIKQEEKYCKNCIKSKQLAGSFNVYKIINTIPAKDISVYMCVKDGKSVFSDFNYIKLGKLDEMKHTGTLQLMD